MRIITFLLLFVLSTNLHAQSLNISVILDLSKRITVEGQIERDIKIIEHLLDEFEKRQREKYTFVKSMDSFQLLIAPQVRGGSNDLSSPSFSIIMNDGKSPLSMSAPVFRTKKSQLLKDVEDLYAKALELEKIEGTSGADIWTVVKSDITQIQTEELDYIYVLSDGYFDFDNDILEFKPAGTYISHSELRKLRNNRDWEKMIDSEKYKLIPLNLEEVDRFTVLELSPYSTSEVYNESDIQKWIWSKWLNESGIEDVQLISKTTFLDRTLPEIE